MSLSELTLLQAMTRAGTPVTRAALARLMSAPRATVTRMLARVVAAGYLVRTGRGQYAFGSELVKLGQAVAASVHSNGKPVLYFDRSSLFSDEVVHGANAVLADYGMHCMAQPCRAVALELTAGERELVTRISGAIITGHWPVAEQMAQAALTWRIPVVRLTSLPQPGCDRIHWNEYEAFKQMTAMTVQAGWRNIIYVADAWNQKVHPSFPLRLHGHRDAMRAAGLRPRVVSVLRTTLESSGADQQLRNAVRSIGANQKVCFMLDNTVLCDGLARAVARLRLDRRRVAHCRSEAIPNQEAGGIPRFLFQIKEPWNELGRLAAHRLIDRLHGDDAPPLYVLANAPIVANTSVHG